jgi:hypothetical protein
MGGSTLRVGTGVVNEGTHMTPHSDHFDGRRFFNPTGANGQPFWRVPQLLLTPRTPWPKRVLVKPKPPPNPGPDEVIVTFIGHSTFLIQAPGANLLIDPVFSERASPLSFAGPRRVRAPGVPLDDLPPISVVLLSHNHYDHCDVSTLSILEQRFHPAAVTPLGNGRLLRSAGFSTVEEVDWWESARGSPLPVTLTPAQHFSARNPFDRNGALWGGFSSKPAGDASSTRETPAMRLISAPSASDSARLIWHCSPSAHTNLAGS